MATTTHAQRATEACRWPTMESVEENLRQARRVVDTARHAAEQAVTDTELNIRRFPLQAVGAATVAGMIAGVLVGFGAGWLAGSRR